jgi:hypothetical protein
MEAQLFVKQLNATSFDEAGVKKFSLLPRLEEFISLSAGKKKEYFQVIAVHHSTEPDAMIEIYAVQTEPTWEFKKPGSIGFSFR